MIYKNKSGLGEVCLGIFLDISHLVGLLMTYWILSESGIIISISTVQRVTLADLNTDVMKKRYGTFDKVMQEKFKDDVILEQYELPTLEKYTEFSEDE